MCRRCYLKFDFQSRLGHNVAHKPLKFKPDRAGLQKAFEGMTDYDVGGFRINLRPKKYESVRAIDLVTITPDGKVVR